VPQDGRVGGDVLPLEAEVRWSGSFGTRQLQEESTKLERLVADLSLGKAMLQDVLAKKSLTPGRRRELVRTCRTGSE
jgi:hypothetical protein